MKVNFFLKATNVIAVHGDYPEVILALARLGMNRGLISKIRIILYQVTFGMDILGNNYFQVGQKFSVPFLSVPEKPELFSIVQAICVADLSRLQGFFAKSKKHVK